MVRVQESNVRLVVGAVDNPAESRICPCLGTMFRTQICRSRVPFGDVWGRSLAGRMDAQDKTKNTPGLKVYLQCFDDADHAL